jgi:hypothetical protein
MLPFANNPFTLPVGGLLIFGLNKAAITDHFDLIYRNEYEPP